MNQPQSPVREFRFSRQTEIRTEQHGGNTYLVGRCASYNVLSSDLGGWFERIKPGTFTRVLREKQDVRHLVNHNADLVLGRTAAGTTVLTEDTRGLSFRTKLGNRSYENDLAESVARGDVNECSFGFIARKSNWVNEPDPANPKQTRCVRELSDVDLFDISTVTFPAYPQTDTGVDMRAMFPQGTPAEVRERIARLSDSKSIDALKMRARQVTLDVEIGEQLARARRKEQLAKEFAL